MVSANKLWCSLLVTAPFALGCRTFSAPDATSFAAARDPAVAVALTERTPDHSLATEIAWIEGNERSIARRRLEQGLLETPSSPELLLRRGALHSAELDDDAALADYLSIIEGAPASPEAEIALLFVHESLSEHLTKRERIARAITTAGMLESRPSSARRVALATAIMSRLDSQSRDETSMRAHVARGGWLVSWRAIGPLAPRTRRSLATPTSHELVEIDPEHVARFRGIAPGARELSNWRTTVSPASGDQNGLYVMESYFEVGPEAKISPVEVEIHLREPSRVRIDGTILHTIDRRNGRQAGTSHVRLRLAPGWHRVSIALLASGATRTGISILREDGAPVILRQRSTRPTDVTPPAPTRDAARALQESRTIDPTRSMAPPGSAEAFIEALAADPDHALFGRILGAQVAATHWNDDLDRAQNMLDPVIEAAPRSAAALAARARLMTRVGLPESLVQAQCRAALRQDEHYPSVLIMLARSIWKDSPEIALSLIERAEREAPRAVEPHLFRFRIFRSRGWNSEAAASLQAALQRKPTEGLLSEGAEFYRALSRVEEASSLERRLPELAEPTPDARLAANFLREGDTDRAIASYRAASRASTNPSGYLSRIASLELARGKIEPAIRAAEAALASDPRQASALRDLSLALAEKGDSAGALRVIDRMRRIGAADIRAEAFSARLRGTALGGVEPGSWLARELDVDTRALVTGAQDSDLRWSGHKSVKLLDRVIDRIREDGSALSVRHVITRLQTKEATDQAGEIKLPDDALPLTLRTIKSDGRLIDVDRHTGKDDLSFSALAPGDAVEREWISIDDPVTPWGGYLRRFFFKSAAPTLRSEFVIVAPRSVPVWWRGYNGAPTPVVRSEANEVVYVWRATEVPAQDPEPSSVPQEEHLPFVAVAIGLEGEIALQANGLGIENLANRSWEIDARAAVLVKGARSEQAKVDAIYRWISSEIGHGGARDPSAVLATRRGDRTGLFAALLRAAEVRAEIALARPGAAASLEDPYPNPSRFSIALVRISLGAAPVAGLDGSDGVGDESQPAPPAGGKSRRAPEHGRILWARMDGENTWLGRAPPEMRGGQYILPEDPSSPPIPIAFRDEEIDRWTLASNVSLAVDESGTAIGAVSMAIPGAYASDLREFLRRARREDAARALQSWVAEVVPGAKLEDFSVANREAPLEPLEVTASILVPQFMVRENEHLVAEQFFNAPIAIRALGFPTLATYLRLPRRTTPLYLNELAERMTVSLTLPEVCSSPIEVPKTFRKKAVFFDFSQRFEWDAAHREARLVTEQSIPARRVPPSEFPAFREGAQEILQGTRNRLIVPLLASQKTTYRLRQRSGASLRPW